jgi:O-acetyl-ADP-ribose deacetylase (regulator of RNase III)
MSLQIIQGDLLDADEPVIAHGCNVKGLMGAGIARQIAERYALLYNCYENECYEGRFQTGDSLAVSTNGRWVFNLATQDKPGPFARYEWIEKSFDSMFAQMISLGLRRVAIPKIGCGIGGLEWDQVEAIIEKVVARVSDDHWSPEVVVYVL